MIRDSVSLTVCCLFVSPTLPLSPSLPLLLSFSDQAEVSDPDEDDLGKDDADMDVEDVDEVDPAAASSPPRKVKQKVPAKEAGKEKLTEAEKDVVMNRMAERTQVTWELSVRKADGSIEDLLGPANKIPLGQVAGFPDPVKNMHTTSTPSGSRGLSLTMYSMPVFYVGPQVLQTCVLTSRHTC